MSPSFQRNICRSLFFVCCVLPTTLVVAWVLVRNRPGRVPRYMTNMSQRLGLHVHLTGVAHPRPGVTKLTGLQLVDPETKQLIAQSDQVTMVCRSGMVRLTMEEFVVERDQIKRLMEWYRDRILRQTLDFPSPVLVFSRSLVLRDENGDSKFSSVRGEWDRIANGPKATWDFKLAGQQSTEPLQITYARDCRTHAPTTHFSLDTRDTPLPCSLLAPLLPVMRPLNAQATFQGQVWAAHASQGWKGLAVGRLSGIELDRVVPPNSLHELTGTAEVTIRELRFRGSKVTRAIGSISAGPGTASRSLLHTVTRVLNLVGRDESALLDARPLEYKDLQLGFQIDTTGLILLGHCENVEAGTIMTDTHGSLLRQPQRQPIPVVRLIRALVPNQNVLVPATQETESLLRVLPLPPLAAVQE